MLNTIAYFVIVIVVLGMYAFSSIYISSILTELGLKKVIKKLVIFNIGIPVGIFILYILYALS